MTPIELTHTEREDLLATFNGRLRTLQVDEHTFLDAYDELFLLNRKDNAARTLQLLSPWDFDIDPEEIAKLDRIGMTTIVEEIR